MNWAEARERLQAPFFVPLRPSLSRLPPDRWPTHDDLNALASGIVTSRDRPLRFIPPRDATGRERRSYELHIAGTGEVETRRENWHDLFNALVWLAFPRAKAAMNAQHVAILEEGGEAEARRRGPARDAITLFDEGGVAVISSDAAVFERIRAFEWKPLFWQERAALVRSTRFVAFGHALLEMLLEPHLGIVAKTVFLSTPALPSEDDLAGNVDRGLADYFSDRSRFASPKRMAPMPVLGIPAWHPRTAEESFYDDRDHFRAKDAHPTRKMEG
jgi:hypothetical protein